jgi:hypothetical protein
MKLEPYLAQQRLLHALRFLLVQAKHYDARAVAVVRLEQRLQSSVFHAAVRHDLLLAIRNGSAPTTGSSPPPTL